LAASALRPSKRIGIVLGVAGTASAASTGVIHFHNGQNFTNGKVNCAAYNNGMTCWPAHNDPKHWAAVALAQGVAVTRGSGSNTKTIYFHNVP
jgi:hypothetical protein